MKWGTYLKERKGLISLMLFIIIFPGMVMAVSEDISFLKSNGCYCIMVSCVISIIYIGYDYIQSKQHYKQLEQLED